MSYTSFNFAEWTKESLEYWFNLAEIYDSYGLPIDLIFLKCREENKLPMVFEKTTDSAGNESARPRPVTSEEFENGIEFCVRIRQAGGLTALKLQVLNSTGLFN